MSTATLELPNQFSVKTISGQIGVDEKKGIVECLVSGIGNKDSVGDVVVSGAFDSSLKRRQPRVVWGHDWNQPIGKVLEIYEIPANDPRLPPKMKQAGIGALYAKVQFNLNTERGREAFANVAFYGNDQEWSIGYKTITADYDPDRQANMLKEVELYEISPVLHGANQLTATLSVKDAAASLPEGVDLQDVSKMHDLIARGMNADVKIHQVSNDSIVFSTDPNTFWKTSYQLGADESVKFEGAVQVVPGEPVWHSVSEEKTNQNFFQFTTGVDTAATTVPYEYDNGGIIKTDQTWWQTYPPYTTYPNATSPIFTYAKCAECEDRKAEEPEEVVERSVLDDLSDAYTKLLTVKGATDVRGKVKEVLREVKSFLDSVEEEIEKEVGLSGYVVHVKCTQPETVQVFQAVIDIPVYATVHEKGIDLRCTDEVEHDELMGMLAKSLAKLPFDPNISVSAPEDTDSED